MNITLPQEQQDWLNAVVAVSRFSSIDEAVAVAVASYMASDSADANSALDEFRRELRRSMAEPSGWRTASPLTQRSTVAAVVEPVEELDTGEAGSGPEADEPQPEARSAPQPEEAEAAEPGLEEGDTVRLAECAVHEEPEEKRRQEDGQLEEKTALISLSTNYGAPGGIEIPEPCSTRSG